MVAWHKMPLREMLDLIELANTGSIKVLPSTVWAYHYPVDATTRYQLLTDLAQGNKAFVDIIGSLRPDSLLYSLESLKKHGFELINSRIQIILAYLEHYHYQRLGVLVTELQPQLSTDDIQYCFELMEHYRVQNILLQAYFDTGKKHIYATLKRDIENIKEHFNEQHSLIKILLTCNLYWLHKSLKLVKAKTCQFYIKSLNKEEYRLWQSINDSHFLAIEQGQDQHFRDWYQVLKQICIALKTEQPTIQQNGDATTSQKQKSHYDPSTQQPQGKRKPQVLFSIKPHKKHPVLLGKYPLVEKNHFDCQQKVWVGQSGTNKYQQKFSTQQRHTISGLVLAGRTELPIPYGYQPDSHSLKAKHSIQLLRDQAGYFVLEAAYSGPFSVDFVRQDWPITTTIAEDLTKLTDFPSQIKHMIQGLNGTSEQKALQIQKYILDHYLYPGDGQDLAIAYQTQQDLLQQPGNYFHNLLNSPCLECYSASNLFVAMARAAAIPCRIAFGHQVDQATQGMAQLTENTGHAWVRIWNKRTWKSLDPTPSRTQAKSKSPQQSIDKTPTQTNPVDEIGQQQSQQSQQDHIPPQSGYQPSQLQSEQQSFNPDGIQKEAQAQELQQAQDLAQDGFESYQNMCETEQDFNQQIEQADTFNELDKLAQNLEQQALLEDIKQHIQDKIAAKTELLKQALLDQLKQMEEDGFISTEETDALASQFGTNQLEQLIQLQRKLEQSSQLFEQYQQIKDEIMDSVDEWYRFFVEHLPREDLLIIDESTQTRSGSLDRRATMKPRNLLLGTVWNPRITRPESKPLFLASIMLDVSNSMYGQKLDDARKLLIFYCELLTRISNEYGYIRFAINLFSDTVVEIKTYEQDYDSGRYYQYDDNMRATVKVRLMALTQVQGRTNMYPAIKKAAQDLNQEKIDYPDYLSAFYFFGDGGDTSGNADNIRQFLQHNDEEQGFGEHIFYATLLGEEYEREELAAIFGENHTNVAPNFDALLEQSMDKFHHDLSEYVIAC